MRKLVLTALAASTAAVVATPALAQSGGPFDGPRIGVIAGYDGLRPGRGADSDISSDNGADGFLYGVDAGYDHQMGRFVLGAEGEISGSTAKTADDPDTTDALGYGRVKAGRDLYAGVRAGYLVGPSTMLYAKGGYTNARLDLTAADGTTTTGQHFNLDGYRLGAGVEQAIGSNTYAKLEYRYSNYGNARLEYANGANTNNLNVDTDRHEVVAGVGFRF